MREPPPFKESEIEFIELDCHGLIALAETTVHHDEVISPGVIVKPRSGRNNPVNSIMMDLIIKS